MLSGGKRLDSWKEIATYLGRSLRTVQRWEQTAGLPVNRLPLGKRGSIIAYTSEIDEWWERLGSQLADEPEVPAPTEVVIETPRYRRRLLAAGAVAGAVVLVAVSIWIWPRPKPIPTLVPLTSYPGVEHAPAFSPDGSRIAFTWIKTRETTGEIYVKVLGTSGPPLQISHGVSNADYPAWAPDGRFVAFLRNAEPGRRDLCVVAALGGPERRIASVVALSNGNFPYLVWSKDGRFIIVSDREGEVAPHHLDAISVESGERRRLTAPPAGLLGDASPVVSPDGSTLAFGRSASVGVVDLYAQRLKLDGSPPPDPVRIAAVGREILGLAWTADGRWLLFSGGGGDALRLWRVASRPRSQPQLVPFLASCGRDIALSPDGKRLAFSDGRWDASIWRAALDGASAASPKPQALITSTRFDGNPRISPDGRKIAFASSRTGAFEIWVSDADGANAVQLTSLNAASGTPRWSPDGSTIAFDARVNRNSDIYLVKAAGGKPVPFTTDPSEENLPSWSHDGKWIYFSSNRGGSYQIWKKPVEGGAAAQLTREGGRAALESVDGMWLYYNRDSGPAAIWRVRPGGGPEIKVFDGIAALLSWDVTASGIYYFNVRPPGEHATSVSLFSFASGRSSLRVEIPGLWPSIGFSVSPDESWPRSQRRKTSHPISSWSRISGTSNIQIPPDFAMPHWTHHVSKRNRNEFILRSTSDRNSAAFRRRASSC